MWAREKAEMRDRKAEREKRRCRNVSFSLSLLFHLSSPPFLALRLFSQLNLVNIFSLKIRTGHSGFVQALNTTILLPGACALQNWREPSVPPDLRERSDYAFSRWTDHNQLKGRRLVEENLLVCQTELRKTVTATNSKQGAMHLKEMQRRPFRYHPHGYDSIITMRVISKRSFESLIMAFCTLCIDRVSHSRMLCCSQKTIFGKTFRRSASSSVGQLQRKQVRQLLIQED